MCLILIGYGVSASLPLVVAANRDEFYARDSRDAHQWDDHPDVFAGRDLQAGGTWLGYNRRGRFAAVTNVSTPDEDAPRSRGELTQAFLTGTMSAVDFASQVEGAAYRGFNLLLWDGAELIYTSNRAPTTRLQPGFYGISNAPMGTHWPKTHTGSLHLQQACQDRTPSAETLLELLNNARVPPDHELPQRGRDLEFERRVAPMFIRGDVYGTRASTALILSSDSVELVEANYGPDGTPRSRHHFSLLR